MRRDSAALQPVSYLSLLLTVATGGGLVLLYEHLMTERLKGALLTTPAAAHRWYCAVLSCMGLSNVLCRQVVQSQKLW